MATRILVCLGALVMAIAAAGQQQPPGGAPAFQASHYDVSATLSPGNQTLFATAQVDFVATQASQTLAVELDPDFAIKSIERDGQPLQFVRVAGQPTGVSISLPEAVSPGQHVTLSFTYSGPLSTADTNGVRLAYIGNDDAYFLLAARWFPVTSIVGQRYTGVFHFTVPQNMAVVGSGTSGAPDTVNAPDGVQPAKGEAAAGQWLRYTFTEDQPSEAGTFAAGGLELTPVSEGGLSLSIYTAPKDKGTAQAYAAEISRIVNFYSSEFGPLPKQNLTVAQLSNVAPMNGAAGPALLLLNQRQWAAAPPERELARLVAKWWWNGMVKPATPSDVWLSDGLARYSELLYEEHAKGESGFRQEIEDCATGALMDESVAPIAQAWQLQPYTTSYESIVRDKGAMVFHMLRTAMGNDAFLHLLREYLQTYAGKTATLDDFEHLVQTQVASLPPSAGSAESAGPPLNTVAFFSQWLNSTGIPEFHMSYIVYRTPKGFKVVGKIAQNLTTLNMPVEVKVETEGNPVTKAVQVVGTSSEFTVDTFGEPKPNGISLDPNDNVLKSTPDLRVRAMIAEGEALAGRGEFFQAVQQYQKALNIQSQNGLALFRMGEAMFFEKNYQAAANSFRDALDGEIPPDDRWVVVWSHVYLGKIYDLIGQRERAVNEYQKALDTKDDTSGALEQARQYMKTAYGAPPAPASNSATKAKTSPASAPAATHQP